MKINNKNIFFTLTKKNQFVSPNNNNTMRGNDYENKNKIKNRKYTKKL